MRRKTPKSGFTLPEILIVASVLVLIGLVVASLFSKGQHVYRHGETHIEMQRQGRRVIGRLAPYLNSMYDADLPVSLPILYPPPDPEQSSDRVLFFTTEDWLADDYPSATSSSLAISAYEQVDALTFLYQVRLESASGNIVLERFAYNSATFSLNNPATYPLEKQFTIHRRRGVEAIANFRFKRPKATVLTLEFDIEDSSRSASNTSQELNEHFRTTFNLPNGIL